MNQIISIIIESDKELDLTLLYKLYPKEAKIKVYNYDATKFQSIGNTLVRITPKIQMGRSIA